MTRWRTCRGERGQIAIPCLFILPSMFLFVFLLYETGKLSREKIRHQFATDAAASVEMTNYSDYLNRTAYGNGAFPDRLFKEAFWDVCIQPKTGAPKLPSPSRANDCVISQTGPLDPNPVKGDRLYEILWKNGAFPRFCQLPDDCTVEPPEYEAVAPDDPVQEPFPLDKDDPPTWLVRFGGCGELKNQAKNPDPNASCTSPPKNQLDLITVEDANNYWLTWDDAQQTYQLYAQAYHLLGSVQESQGVIFEETRKDQMLYRKSYWLNSGASEGKDGAGAFPTSSFLPKHYCVKNLMVSGSRPTKNTFQPYQIYKPPNAVDMEDSESIKGCGGLYQFTAIDPAKLNELRYPSSELGDSGEHWPGLSVFQHWDKEGKILGNNFFGVDFASEADCPSGGGGPCVHATVSVQNPAQGGTDDQNGVWPNPTPKFQVRLRP